MYDLNQIQALHAIVQQKYTNRAWLVYPNMKSEDRNAVIALILSMNDLDRPQRLTAVNCILPLQEKGKAIEISSFKELLLAEIYGLLDWLRGNPTAKAVLKLAATDASLRMRVRDYLGYVTRPRLINPGAYFWPEEED